MQSCVLQPILVRPLSSLSESNANEEQSFEIVAGERRFRAAKRAGLAQVPVLVREFTDKEFIEVSIVENVQRSQLSPIEEAEAYHRLHSEFELSQEEIAKTVGKDRATIANSLRLLKLPTDIRTLVAEGKISAGHARALLMIEDAAAQLALADLIVRDSLSVRVAEQYARAGGLTVEEQAGKVSQLAKSGQKAKSDNPEVVALEERIRRALGTKVKLLLGPTGSGELKISFFSNEELEKLLELFNA